MGKMHRGMENPSKGMKILHVLTSSRAEGTPRLVLDWLKQKDFDQHVLFLQTKPADLKEEFQNATKNIYFAEQAKSKNPIKRATHLPKLAKGYCNELKPDVFICWNQGYGYLLAIGAKRAKVENIMVHAGCAPEIHPRWGNLYSALSAYFLRISSATIMCASKHILNEYKQLPFLRKCSFKQVYNCLDLSKFEINHSSIRKKQAIYVANLEVTKDHKSLLQAWKLAVDKDPQIHLLCVGRGSLKFELEAYTVSLGIENNVKFTGYRTDIPELMNESQLFVFSSTNKEGFGTVLLEALSTGLQVISFDEPAPREVLQNGKYGILVPNRNIEIFANQIISAFENPLSSENIKLNVQYTKSFSVQKMMEGYLEGSCE